MSKLISPIRKARLASIPQFTIIFMSLIYFYVTGQNDSILFYLFIFIGLLVYTAWVGALFERANALAILKLYGIDELKYNSLKSDVEEGIYTKYEGH